MTRYPTRWLLGVAVFGAALVAGIIWADAGAQRPVMPATPVTPGQASAFRGEPGPATEVDVLRSWDRRRASAYSRGDVAALRDLYVDGAAAAGADTRMLRGYTSRGLRLEGMRMQILAVEVLARRPNLWRLRVTDRLVGAVAIGPAGHTRLPRDQASTNVVTLVRSMRGPWRVASVR